MNQMASDLKHMLDYSGVKVEALGSYSTGVWLADRPCTVKGQKDCIWPQDAMLKLLSQSASADVLS